MAVNYVKAIPITLVDSATLPVGFDPVDPNGLPFPCFLIRIVNASNQPVIVSYDGVTPNDYVPANSFVQLNFQTNSQPGNNVALLKKGQVVYIGGPAGVGFIYLIGYYQPVEG